MPRTCRVAVVMAAFMALLVSATGGNAAELKVANACSTVTNRSTPASTFLAALSSTQVAKATLYCKQARLSANKLEYWDKSKNEWRLYKRHKDEKCWKIDDLRESVPTCIKVRKVLRIHTQRLVKLNTKIGQIQTRSFELYDGYVPPETARQMGMKMAADMMGWTVENGQFTCLDQLWGDYESSWNMHSDNPVSTAFGIPQALPGTKMGLRWKTSAWTQIRWGFGYISGRYGTPCSALAWRLANGWY